MSTTGNSLRRLAEVRSRLFALTQAFERADTEQEGALLDEAHALTVQAVDSGIADPHLKAAALEIFLRLADHSAADRLGDFTVLGRALAPHTPFHLLFQMPRVRSDSDRTELLHQHQEWARSIDTGQRVSLTPRRQDGRLRVGLLSDDLRMHVVGRFAAPLFLNKPNNVDLYAYAHRPSEDRFQLAFRERATFRFLPDDNLAAAKIIASDSLDVLVEISGATGNNRPAILTHRPAPVQVSWLGYPHSVGISAIDYNIIDQYLASPFTLEKQMIIPCWLTITNFPHSPIDPILPSDRRGHITFGTLNATYKLTREVLGCWAAILAKINGSKLLIVRPESASAVFRRNVLLHFGDIDPGRVEFRPVRSKHLQHYNDIDIALDSFPLTGGTTTCEALWMGVPVVSLSGPSRFERLSHSILNQAGAGFLSASSLNEYTTLALTWASDKDLRTRFRYRVRAQLMRSKLGDAAGLTENFYAALGRMIN